MKNTVLEGQLGHAADALQDAEAYIKKLETAVYELISTIENTNGLELDRRGVSVPAGDPEWGDLARAYTMACAAVGKEPVYRKEDE